MVRNKRVSGSFFKPTLVKRTGDVFVARISESGTSQKGRVMNILRSFAVSSTFPLLTNYPENRFVSQNRVQYEENPSFPQFLRHHNYCSIQIAPSSTCILSLSSSVCPLHSIEKGELGGLHLHDLSSVTPKVI